MNKVIAVDNLFDKVYEVVNDVRGLVDDALDQAEKFIDEVYDRAIELAEEADVKDAPVKKEKAEPSFEQMRADIARVYRNVGAEWTARSWEKVKEGEVKYEDFKRVWEQRTRV
jgi:hypothetical protein